ncbi:MAG TPA: ankyrin repeat domain-containing protein [Terriglobia bacterium]|nr:ankyrin repeat domain-containing protein [Terriglobia bacterium]
MDFNHLPFDSSLHEYQAQAAALFKGWKAGDAGAIHIVKTKHPKFLDERVPWLPKKLPDSEIRAVTLELADAELVLARWYDFHDWLALAKYAESVAQKTSAAYRFEAAVESVISGDLDALQAALAAHPDLAHARSERITHFDPPAHRATLLHYVAANGTEGYRQKCPANAVAVAETLLQANAEVDALADLYGGRCTTMSLLVSSCHPAAAGLQVPLVDKLLDWGAAIEGRGSGHWVSPLMTALVFGYLDAAHALVRRGARVDSLSAAAGLGRTDRARELLAGASGEDRHRALVFASQHGHVEMVRLLLDAGEDPNRYNPKGTHSHCTPLHQAAAAGHEAVVRLLVEKGAKLDIKDTIFEGTPLGWAEHGGRTEVADYLRQSGAA